MNDLISRQAAIDAVTMGALSTATLYGRTDEGATALKEIVSAIKALPSAQPEITYQTCSDALLKMWMDNVLTDSEYNRIMDKLNAWKGNPNAD